MCTRFPIHENAEQDERSLILSEAAQPNWPARIEHDGQVFAQHLPEMACWQEPDDAAD